MTIAEDTMKVIGVFLITCLAGCDLTDSAPDAAPSPLTDAGPGPVPDAAPFCSLATRDCQPWWSERASDAGVTSKSISYNAMGTNSLLFNALLRNPEANYIMANYALGLNGLLWGTDDEAKSFRRQLRDPFARRIMSYLVGCALPENASVTWVNESVSAPTAVTWQGDLGLCPGWSNLPMDQKCQELLSACLLARNNALDREVLISVRGVRQDDPTGAFALPLERMIKGGKPCESEIQSFESACSLIDHKSNCLGWDTQYIGACHENDTVQVTVNVPRPSTPWIRICHGTSGCDFVDPNDSSHVVSKSISCTGGSCQDTIEFTCSAKQAFTLMYANASDTDFSVSVTGATYPALENEIFRWAEGAFYGNLFCPDKACIVNNKPVMDTSLTVQVQQIGDDEKIVYLWSSGNEIMDVNGTTERELLVQRNEKHRDFVDAHPAGANGLFSNLVYQSMYACVSPNWDPATAYAKSRFCAGPSGGKYCAARPTGRCWSAADEPCQCTVDDVDDPRTTSDLGDRDYGDCSDNSSFPWQHPVTVFLNDPCDIVRESVYPGPDEATCTSVPICRQTTSPDGPLLLSSPDQQQPPDPQQPPP